MANKDLKWESHSIKGMPGWFYEEPKGLVFVIPQSTCQSGIDKCTGLQFCISWRLIRAALKRKDK